MGVPTGFNTLSCYLIVPDAKEAIEFYKKALGAEGGVCMEMPDGSVMHAELAIGNSKFMLSSENPQWDMKSPATLGGSPASMHIYCDDVDGLYAKATEAGMQTIMPPNDAFWGDRYAKVVDPYGYQWGIACQIKEMTPEELEVAKNQWLAEMAEQGGGSDGE